MVFEHPMRMMNLLTRLGWDVKLALHEGTATAKVAREVARDVVDYMLFVDEAPMPPRRIETMDSVLIFTPLALRVRSTPLACQKMALALTYWSNGARMKTFMVPLCRPGPDR